MLIRILYHVCVAHDLGWLCNYCIALAEVTDGSGFNMTT